MPQAFGLIQDAAGLLEAKPMRTALTAVGFLLLVIGIVMLITGPADAEALYLIAVLAGAGLSAAGLLTTKHGRRHRHGRSGGPRR